MSDCQCYTCVKDRDEKIPNTDWPVLGTRMIVCGTCGNKRCPHGTDHRLACTGSNEPGQAGSRYA